MMYNWGSMGQMMNNFLGNCGGSWLFFGGLLFIFWWLFQILLGIGILILIWLWIKKLLKEIKK
ncbi:MAG: hypothetical protein NTV77_03285 [Candidatus Azambacteria bacterium]|nr:hypothetical protein [Candidatus Azambacteria bacterium]